MFRYHSYLKALCSSSQRIFARNLTGGANYLPLPKLPVPALKDTLTRYLRTVKPFLNDEEYRLTEKRVNDFASGVGAKLQELLMKRAETKDNWLADWWLKVAYMEFRSPVVYFSSPGLVFPKTEFRNADDRIRYASQLVAAAVNFKLTIHNHGLKQDMMRTIPQDMSQYYQVFGTCRIPNKPGDLLEFHPNSRHIVVMHKNHMFKLDVVTPGGTAVGTKQLARNLKRIFELSRKPAPPIGILTSNNRDDWADDVKLLKGHEENWRSLDTIADSLFVLCFDSQLPPAPVQFHDMNLAASLCMHGGGSRYNGGNRWYDKTIQFIIGDEGHVGLTYEHSPAEGVAIARMMDHIVDKISANEKDSGAGGDCSESDCQIQELEFCLSKEVEQRIKKAASNLDELVGDVETACFKFDAFGKDFIKTLKLSPDSFLQMAMQYAFYRIHKEPGAHYESAALRSFAGGRTETIRSCSLESVKFAQTMLSSKASKAEKVQTLKAAVDGHRKLAMEASQGQGVDRHLLGLKLMAQEKGIEVPDLYTDPGYVRSLHMRMSTSQVPSKSDGFMVYGPLVPDGYGCCYNPRDNDVNFGITAHVSDSGTSATNFRDALERSLLDMRDLFIPASKY
ncbi:carnitine O-acetyltransferase isoform X2 [Nilaparvata lugens]|nr:carnitine O-acetyltransferase isoform X2 [Nilaparvata lugens]XP_039278605.1 carnitine O-acetyltransferase isoform X2 [Nilaparvata lugens]XP_039278607.1 carnitine O-acetyltransferase isoform X2 [Nilaparvata lugens]